MVCAISSSLFRLRALLTFESRIDQLLFRFPYGVLEKTVPKMIWDDWLKHQSPAHLKMRRGSVHRLVTLSECREGAKCCSKVSAFSTSAAGIGEQEPEIISLARTEPGRSYVFRSPLRSLAS